MDRPEVIRALKLGHDTIVNLRREVAELRPKAHAYDTIAQMTRLSEHPNSSYGEVDPVWTIRSLLEKLDGENDAV